MGKNPTENNAHSLVCIAQKLTQEQLDFCEEYLLHYSVAKAYEKVYATREDVKQKGKVLLTHPYIKAYLDERREQIAHAFVTPEDLRLKALKVFDRCMQNEKVYDKKGHPTGEYTFNAHGATKVLELLFKTAGLLDGANNIHVDLAGKDTKPPVQVNIDTKTMKSFKKLFDKDY